MGHAPTAGETAAEEGPIRSAGIQAAAHSSQLFMLVGALVLVPLILAYTAWSYWVFRAKVGEGGYH